MAYQNRIKTEVLNVEEAVINKLGAVSKPVAEQMAKGVRDYFGTDTAIATTGIAGPDGGTAEKKVGTTWISVVYKDKVLSKKYQFGGSRERIIAQASFTALQLLRRLIMDQV